MEHRAVFLRDFKSPLEIRTVYLDETLSTGEVLVKVDAAGVCYRDVLTVDGYIPIPKKPVVPGHEIAGRIMKVGEGVLDFKEGDRVTSLIHVPCGNCHHCLREEDHLCRNRKLYGEDFNGSYAEHVKADTRSLIKIDEGISAEAAAISACVTGMLIHALKYRAGLSQGEKVLVTGAGGGVGIHAVQVVKALGSAVIAYTTSEWKADAIKKAGADHVIVSTGNFSEEARKITEGEGVDLVLEAVGKPTLEQSLRSVRRGGRVVVVGNVDPQPVPVALGIMILKENSILGSYSSRKKDVVEALKLSAEGKITPIIHDTLRLNQAQEAHDILRRRGALGRIILRP